MNDQEKELAKKYMLESRKFQKWVQDTQTHEMKENPDWQEAVTEVLDRVMDDLGDESTYPDVRQDIEQMMVEYVEEHKNDKRVRTPQTSNELDPETEERKTPTPDEGDSNA